MNSPTQMLLNSCYTDIPQTNSGASNNIYDNGGFPMDFIDANDVWLMPEPMAANEGLGAF